MAGLMLGGLASGMDTQTIIAQLMAIERQPKTRLLGLERRAEARKSALDEIGAQLRALKTAVSDLRSTATWADVQAITSSDATKVTARQIGTAPPGNVTVEVLKLARVEQRTFDYQETTDILGFPRAQRITVDGNDVDIAAGTSLQGVADAINAKTGITVYAGVVNNQLVLTGKTLGQAVAVSSSTNSVTEDAAKQVLAQKTGYKVNGVLQNETIATTVQPGGLPGVELTLKALTPAGSPVTISIGSPAPDTEKLTAKVKAFVDAYNKTVDLVRAKVSEKPVTQPTTTAEYAKGSLYNDIALTGLLGRLRQTVSDAVVDPAIATGRDQLAEIGVTVPAAQSGPVSQDRLIGKLTLDETKFAEALAADPTGVEELLGAVAGVNGITQKLEGLIDPVARLGDGVLATRSTQADGELSGLRRRSAEMDKRLELKEQRLRAQFTAMERALAMSQSQSSWLTGQLNGLS